jgi:hypothetical protein
VLEERGVATATICSDEFAQLGQAEAAALGMPSLPIVVVPHPVADLKAPEVRSLAETVFPDIVRALTQPRELLTLEGCGKVYPPPKRVFVPRPAATS